MARSSSSNSTFSIIGEDVEITGNIKADVELHIDGKVIGDIVCQSLVQGESSEITGAVIAQTASLSGAIEGSIEANDLTISRSARIKGDVSYENVTIEQGGHVEGQFRHKTKVAHGINKPSKEVSAPATLELTEGDKAA